MNDTEKRGPGRPRLGPDEGKRASFQTRTTRKTRARIDRRAKESGRSVSGEIEHMLEIMLERDDYDARLEREAAERNLIQPDEKTQAADHLELDVRELVLDLGAAFERRSWGADARAIAARLLVNNV